MQICAYCRVLPTRRQVDAMHACWLGISHFPLWHAMSHNRNVSTQCISTHSGQRHPCLRRVYILLFLGTLIWLSAKSGSKSIGTIYELSTVYFESFITIAEAVFLLKLEETNKETNTAGPSRKQNIICYGRGEIISQVWRRNSAVIDRSRVSNAVHRNDNQR